MKGKLPKGKKVYLREPTAENFDELAALDEPCDHER